MTIYEFHLLNFQFIITSHYEYHFLIILVMSYLLIIIIYLAIFIFTKLTIAVIFILPLFIFTINMSFSRDVNNVLIKTFLFLLLWINIYCSSTNCEQAFVRLEHTCGHSCCCRLYDVLNVIAFVKVAWSSRVVSEFCKEKSSISKTNY